MAKYISKGRYYLTVDKRRVVPEGDPAAAFLYVTEGREVDQDEAKRLGLLDLDQPAKVEPKAKVAATDEADDDEADAPEAKAMHAAPEDKSLPAPRGPSRQRGH